MRVSELQFEPLASGFSRCRVGKYFIASVCMGSFLMCACAVPQAEAQTSSQVRTIAAGSSSQILPSARHEIAGEEPLSWTISRFPPQQYMKEIYWRSSKETPAFFRDSLLQFVPRTYYFTRDNFDGSKSQAWAGGGWLAFRSGLIGNLIGVHAAYYTSQNLFGPADQSGTKLLGPDQKPLNSLGQIYGRVQFGDQEFRGGRQLVDTPLINAQDNRMVPNTFEGTTVVTLPDADRNYDYAFGYIWTVKQRDSNHFISMSDALAGGNTVNHGTTFGMVKYRPLSGLSLVFMDYYIEDNLNAAFAQAEYNFQRPKEVPNWILGANVIDQRSVGADLLTGSHFQTYQASAKVQMKYTGWTFFVVGSITGDGSKLYSPFGSKPNYTDMQQSSFDNAGEKAIGGGIEFDFGTLGLPGVGAGVWYSSGSDAIDTTSNTEMPGRKELDLWLQYRPTEGPLKGLRMKTQYADVWQKDNVRDDQPEFRFILDYTVLFRPPIEK